MVNKSMLLDGHPSVIAKFSSNCSTALPGAIANEVLHSLEKFYEIIS